AAVSIRARGGLKIKVLSALSDAQQKTLVERYRRLINQPWLRAMRLPERTARGARSAEQPTE
ncbi:MAG: hypothetical protein V3U03_06995, partial [Myxococcota bacterium]